MTRHFRIYITTLYRTLSNRFSSLAPCYRWIAHRELLPPFHRTFARGLHEAIKRECGHLRGGIFFEAGANDGLLSSNTAYLERYCNWKGILVEAVPHKYLECVKNRPGSIVEHCALVSPEFPQPYVEIHYYDLTSRAPMLTAANSVRHIIDGREYLLDSEKCLLGQMFFAPPMTIGQVLAKHGIRHIDFMTLDLEGAESEALKGIDFGGCQIDRILVEALDGPQTIDDFLVSKHGFRRSEQWSQRDYLYRRV